MIRRWLRVVVPEEAAGVFLLLYVANEALAFLFDWHPELGVLPVVAAILYGRYRIKSFHPYFYPDYAKWLAQTPWTSRHPLPRGPIHLVPQDLFVTGLVTLAAVRVSWLAPHRVPLVALVTYLSFLTLSLFPTGVRAYGYVLAFGVGLIVRCWEWPAAAWTIAFVLYVWGWTGLRLALRKFPWNRTWSSIKSYAQPTSDETKTSSGEQLLAWPFDVLAPVAADRPLPVIDRTLLCVLAGWWVYVVYALFQNDGPNRNPGPAGGGLFLVLLLLFLVICRVAAYKQNHASPINLWGRMFTFRWIIPSYDKMYVAPLATILVFGVMMNHLVQNVDPDYHVYGIPVIATCMLLTTFLIGPTLRSWRLTGSHRLTPSSRSSNQSQAKSFQLTRNTAPDVEQI